MLKLHSMCAAQLAHLGKTRFLLCFLPYCTCTHFSPCLYSSWFLPLAPLFIFCFIMKLVALVYNICYFSMYFYRHRFYLELDSTAPFYSMVLARLELFLCMFSLFFLLNRCLLFCGMVYCIFLPVLISVYKFSLS